MTGFPSFKIDSKGKLSEAFIQRNITTFDEACLYIRSLPYGRNINKNELLSLFTDNCGTCSTKHALLKTLAVENGKNDINLMVGIFKMNANNTPKIRSILEHYQLNYLPEAHCYLKYQNQIIDYTNKNSEPTDFIDDLMEEKEINPNQITDFKVNYHLNYLKNWLQQNPHIKYNLKEIWRIREECIQGLTTF